MARKILNADNLLLPDPTSQLWISVDDKGTRRTVAAVDWAEAILPERLEPTVPWQLREQYEIAQAILAYGYFWHPMYAFGARKALLVAEAAVTLKCESLGARKKSVETFHDRIVWLRGRGVLSDEDVLEWEALRELQSSTAQQTERVAFPGTWSLALLDRIARAANALFRKARAAA